MKIARFTAAGDDPRYGILDDEEFVVLAGDPLFGGFDTTGERVLVAQSKLLAPVIPRSKVIGVTADGMVYLKPNTAVVGPGDAIQLPPTGAVTAAGVLAVVIGSLAKRVPAADAASVIFGYTVGTDVTAADQLEAGQWALAKGYDTFAPIGPVMETEFDASGAQVVLGGSTGTVSGVAAAVERVSAVWTLLPGDVILIGTSAPAVTLVVGDSVSVEIDGIGILTNPVRGR
ncbi:MAG: 2-hydroxyhepta-2,4-diene,7-dioate isomerase [Microbacteriaceae bacterium]|nr:2-hydroxyhepta-2,4-diene,7-dioate isomerase [Microbacteriaceae bacterium]